MVCMLVIGVRVAYLVHSQHTVFCDLPHVLAANQHILDDAAKNIIYLSTRRIGIRLPAEDDLVLCSKAYKVCYISI